MAAWIRTDKKTKHYRGLNPLNPEQEVFPDLHNEHPGQAAHKVASGWERKTEEFPELDPGLIPEIPIGEHPETWLRHWAESQDLPYNLLIEEARTHNTFPYIGGRQRLASQTRFQAENGINYKPFAFPSPSS